MTFLFLEIGDKYSLYLFIYNKMLVFYLFTNKLINPITTISVYICIFGTNIFLINKHFANKSPDVSKKETQNK